MPQKKPVTVDDYRKDRDYWKRRALNQQNAIDTVNRHNDRLKNENKALRGALDTFRANLEEVCPHDKLDDDFGKSFDNKYYCKRCFNFIKKEDV